MYHENRDKEIEEENNPHYGEPFPAFRGHVLFRDIWWGIAAWSVDNFVKENDLQEKQSSHSVQQRPRESVTAVIFWKR